MTLILLRAGLASAIGEYALVYGLLARGLIMRVTNRDLNRLTWQEE